MRGFPLAAGLVLLLAPAARAAGTGTSTAQFLRLGVGARASGLGDAASAVLDDAAVLTYNPAGLVRVERNSVELMHAPYLVDTFYDYAALAHRLEDDQAVGAALQYFNAGSIGRTDELGQDLGAAHPTDLAFTLGYAYRLSMSDSELQAADGASVGLSISYIQSTIVHEAHTLAFGLGALSRPYGAWKARLSLAADNLGGQLTFDQQSDPLPAVYRAGLSFIPLEGLTVGLEALSPRDGPAAAAAGAEAALGSVRVRAGYNTTSAGDAGGLSGFAAGLGFRQESWSVDYAFVPFGRLGDSHRLSLGLRF